MRMIWQSWNMRSVLHGKKRVFIRTQDGPSYDVAKEHFQYVLPNYPVPCTLEHAAYIHELDLIMTGVYHE